MDKGARPYSEDALELKLSLEVGVIGVDEVITWADTLLGEVAEYDDDLANICLAKDASVKALISLLRIVIGECKEWNAMRRTMARMHEALVDDPNRARGFVRFLEQFWIRHDYDVPEDMDFIVGIEDEFQLAEQGTYGTVVEAKASLLESLSHFRKYIRPGLSQAQT